MFINKIKEQLMTEKACANSPSVPSPSPQPPAAQTPTSQAPPPQTQQQQPQQQQGAVQTYPVSLGNSGDASAAPSSTGVTENMAVLPLPSPALMAGLVITSPSSDLTASSGGLSPLAHGAPTFSLAGGQTMIVAAGAPPPQAAGPDKKPGEEGRITAATEAPAQGKAPGSRKRKARPSEASLSDLDDPYALPNDEEGGKDGKAY
ncbi:synapsin-1-like, partial [Chiloscyllium plagiosum]|uniref:synapsin-1-like n=1 Tax=Chiloscyllium plagiosum TaxID=36176 RepID=UPI001CB7C3CA